MSRRTQRDGETEQAHRRLPIAMPPALRHPAFRLYWLGTLASVTGYQMLQASQFWLVHEMEESPLYLGYVGLANAIPAIAFNLLGGVLADKLDKKRLILVTQLVMAAVIFLLATLIVLEAVRVWHVLTIAVIIGAVGAFDQPARQALYPYLIDRKAITSAVALSSAIWQGTRIVGPAIAGFLIATAGTGTAIYVSGAGFVVMAGVLYALKTPNVPPGAQGRAVHEMLEGVRFIWNNSVFSFLIGMSFFNSFFGMAYVILMPVLAEDVLGQGPEAYGALLSAGGVGALLGTMWLSSISGVRGKGTLIIGGAVAFGLSIMVFGLTSQLIGSYVLALGIMFVSGIFNSVYLISVMSALQIMVPDGMRGRVMGFFGITWSMMPLGGMQAGAIASFIGAPAAIAVGGLAVGAFALGPALVNSRVRKLGVLLQRYEPASP